MAMEMSWLCGLLNLVSFLFEGYRSPIHLVWLYPPAYVFMRAARLADWRDRALIPFGILTAAAALAIMLKTLLLPGRPWLDLAEFRSGAESIFASWDLIKYGLFGLIFGAYIWLRGWSPGRPVGRFKRRGHGFPDRPGRHFLRHVILVADPTAESRSRGMDRLLRLFQPGSHLPGPVPGFERARSHGLQPPVGDLTASIIPVDFRFRSDRMEPGRSEFNRNPAHAIYMDVAYPPPDSRISGPSLLHQSNDYLPPELAQPKGASNPDLERLPIDLGWIKPVAQVVFIAAWATMMLGGDVPRPV